MVSHTKQLLRFKKNDIFFFSLINKSRTCQDADCISAQYFNCCWAQHVSKVHCQCVDWRIQV